MLSVEGGEWGGDVVSGEMCRRFYTLVLTCVCVYHSLHCLPTSACTARLQPHLIYPVPTSTTSEPHPCSVDPAPVVLTPPL